MPSYRIAGQDFEYNQYCTVMVGYKLITKFGRLDHRAANGMCQLQFFFPNGIEHHHENNLVQVFPYVQNDNGGLIIGNYYAVAVRVVPIIKAGYIIGIVRIAQRICLHFNDGSEEWFPAGMLTPTDWIYVDPSPNPFLTHLY